MRGETVYVGGTAVDNVLVSPGDHTVEADVSIPAGTVVAYMLAFPESYGLPISDQKITVRGHVCDSVGFSDHARFSNVFEGLWDTRLCPWDMIVPVKLCDGEMAAEVVVYSVSSTYDALGDPTLTRTPVYSGCAQARMGSNAADSGEKISSDGTTPPLETWYFVMPWQPSFAGLRPQSSEIDVAGNKYDVRSIENIGMRSEYASFTAALAGPSAATSTEGVSGASGIEGA